MNYIQNHDQTYYLKNNLFWKKNTSNIRSKRLHQFLDQNPDLTYESVCTH